jgi:dTDP-4-amino-4,6-dideoxygalactose transaminase
MNVPLVDLPTSIKKSKKEIFQTIKKAIISSSFILGDQVKEFEDNFAKYVGAKYCIGVGSGTDALMLSLKAYGIGEGDEVIIPAFTFIATALAVIHAGARPVFVDIIFDSHLIDYKEIENRITKKTKVIIPVHLYGQPCEMDEIKKIAKKHKLIVLEDACQAHGSLYKKKYAGALGDVAAFSFYPAKNLGAFGDAGAITTSNKKIAEKLILLRNYGAEEKYVHKLIGYNSRLDSLQAAILNIKLRFLDKQNKKRKKHAHLYSSFLKDLPVELSSESTNIQSNYHLYTICVKKRNELLEYLKSKNIYCGIHYPMPLHLQPALVYLNHKIGDFPISEKVASETLSLPMYPEMTNEQIEYICKQIKEFFENDIQTKNAK